jgi:hypothetical protein
MAALSKTRTPAPHIAISRTAPAGGAARVVALPPSLRRLRRRLRRHLRGRASQRLLGFRPRLESGGALQGRVPAYRAGRHAGQPCAGAGKDAPRVQRRLGCASHATRNAPCANPRRTRAAATAAPTQRGWAAADC